MRYTLDTNACISFLRQKPGSKIAEHLAAANPSDVAISSVALAELLYGAQRSQKSAANLAQVRLFASQFPSLPFDDPSAEAYGQIRVALERAGTPIGPNDLMIAAIAVSHGVTLVTHNTTEFTRVPGLNVVDWEI